MFRTQKQKQAVKTLSRQLKAQIDAAIEIRTETLLGREYLVVPVVAMVEGVRFGANADAPELGLAVEFGADVITWANRPLVLNHPQMEFEGEIVYCSANSPEILDQYAFGMTMNPYIEDSKLKMEAWIDVQRVADLGGEFADIVTLIESGEMVEVSVGFFSTLEPKKGKFNGQAYGGIWRNIKPDHLAILSIGTLGACSNADGCGIPRINKEAVMPKTTATTPTPIKVDNTQGCGCGGHDESTCTCNDHADATTGTPESVVDPELDSSTKPTTQEGSPEEVENHLADEADRAEVRAFNAKLIAQAISGTLTDSDVRRLINNAMRKKWPTSDAYLYAFTQDTAIIESYGYVDGTYGYRTYQIGINVTESGVEFVGEAQEVVLLTKIVSAQDTNTTVQTKEIDMTETSTPSTTPTTTEVATPTPTAQATQPAAPLTAQQYVDQAPAEVREMLQASMRLHADKKNALIKTVLESKGNRFGEETLKTFDLAMLENLAALAGVVQPTPNYSGVAAPVAPVAQAEAIPAPPRLFSKPANAA